MGVRHAKHVSFVWRQKLTWENITLSDWHPRGATGARSTTLMIPLSAAPAHECSMLRADFCIGIVNMHSLRRKGVGGQAS